MTLDEIDRALLDWKARRQRIDDNLVALETDPVCMLLEQAQGAGLEGATRDRVAPALAAMRELFAQRSLLDEALERAVAIRKGINRLWPGDSLQEIERVLRGPSIALPPVETPLARRGLLDAAETTSAISPDQLLGAMIAAFEGARDAVAAVAAAWDHLTPALDRARAEATRLATMATDLGGDATAALAPVRAQLDAVQARVARDPLGATRALTDDVTSRLAQLSQHLEALVTRRTQAQAHHQQAVRVLADLRAAHDRAVAADDEAAREVTADGDRPHPAEQGAIDGLAQWLTTLDGTIAAHRWEAADVGLKRWLASARGALEAEVAAEAAATGLIARRADLTGRLSARRQQAKTLRARGRALDPGLDDLAARAEALLATTPCPLEEIERVVAAYEAGLRG